MNRRQRRQVGRVVRRANRPETIEFGQRIAVLLSWPPDHPLAKHGRRIVSARYGVASGETRLWDFEHDGKPLVDLPDDLRYQLPANAPVYGRLVVDDGARVRVVERLSS